MAKRLKRVFTNKDQVLHLWANQSQTDARCSNVFFDGESCYSYGHHYELGRLVEFNGKTVALINSYRYSNTTAKHIRAAWSACSHLIRVESNAFSDIRGSFVQWQDRLINEIFDYFKSRSKTWYDSFDDQWWVTQLNEFNHSCELLGFSDLKLEPDVEFKELWLDHRKCIQARLDFLNTPEQLLIKQAQREKRLAKKREKYQQEIDLWLNNEKSNLTYDARQTLSTHLIRVKDNEVQTSGGARVPLDHALRLLNIIEKGSIKSGERVGHFSVNKLDGIGNIIIGCHTINIEHAKTVLSAYKKPQLSIVS